VVLGQYPVLTGRLVIFPFWLKAEKKLLPTVVILDVSKLQSGRLLRAPSLLKQRKKSSPTLVALDPKREKSVMELRPTLAAVVQAFGTRGLQTAGWKVRLVAPPVKERVM